MAISSESAAVRKILLLSGTSEGPLLARALTDAGFQVLATVTRAEACATLFGTVAGIEVEARGFSESSLTDFLTRRGAALVLDATHPFAVRITRIAQAVCARLGVPYVRYERPDWAPPPVTILVTDFAEAARRLSGLGQRVLFTIGCKQLKHFAHLHGELEMFARILPGPESVQPALAAGFRAANLVCLRPPFTREANRELMQQLRIDVLVTKASGQEGGVVEKVLAAHQLGVKVVMIQRPTAGAPAQVSSVADALAACRRHFEDARS